MESKETEKLSDEELREVLLNFQLQKEKAQAEYFTEAAKKDRAAVRDIEHSIESRDKWTQREETRMEAIKSEVDSWRRIADALGRIAAAMEKG